MKKGLKLITLAMCMAITNTACGRSTSDVENTLDEKEQLLIWSYYETEAQANGLDKLTASFNKSQDKYQVSWEYVPMTEFDKKISRAYTEQELPDVVIIDNPDMKKFIQLDMFEDISEYASTLNLDTDYYEASVDTIKYNDKYYGVPFNSNNVCLIYRSDLLKAAGVTSPKTWDELSETAKLLSKDGSYGFLMSAMDSEQGSFQLLSWVMAASDSDTQLTREAISESYDYLAGLIKDGCMPADCLNYSQTDIARRFIEGDIAMMENGPWVFPMLDEAGISYGLSPMPMNKRNAVILGGENLGIIKGKNVEGSIEFIKYCMEQGGTERFCSDANLLPSRIKSANKIIVDNPKLEIISQQMNYAIPRTGIDGYSRISKQLPKSFADVVTGELTPDEAAGKTLN
ncbi:sugar ABC transporter substrate-binding protein [Pseudobutyrivibrio xylanivorans]|uniref:Multiple sugar transport system substrate-binding protein n=1 Tax=Pseudobutyrivibrio xylanivorans TaxID=185007 RepID=A0A1G5RQG8_PSEXY|nr:extracellular solute-binding protein [Pseudobutyrivibrio xylanivorans]SCZ76342.1 multiple sugar transport system substrate-binding protein [Pseudobutyrivibrio xylanivorans]